MKIHQQLYKTKYLFPHSTVKMNNLQAAVTCPICLDLLVPDNTSVIMCCNNMFQDTCIQELAQHGTRPIFSNTRNIERFLFNCPCCRHINSLRKNTYKANGALKRMVEAALDGVKEEASKKDGLQERMNRLEIILANMQEEKERNKQVMEDEEMDF